MMRSLWTASTGMVAMQMQIDTMSNNLANVNTVGFKKSRAEFEDLMYQTLQVAGTETVGGEDQVIPAYVREKIPPIMFVRAIMVAGRQSMAIMDIEGVGTGIIVRSGYSFSNGEGKVVRIGPDKVTVNWSGKNLDLAPGL